MAVTQKSYVDNSSSVKAARKKLEAAKAALSDANKAKAGLPSSAGKDLANQIDARITQAEKDLDKSLSDVTEVETKAKDYFTKNEASIQEKAVAKEKATGESNIASVEAQRAQMAKAGLDTTAIDKIIADAKTKVVPTTKTPLPKIDIKSQANVDNINKQLDQQIKDARKTLLAMSGPDRKTLAKTLTDAGFAVTPTEQFQDNLLLQYQNAINLAKSQNTNNKGLIDPVNLTQFLANKTVLNNELKAAQGGTTGTGQKPTASISSQTEAETYINDVFKSVLNRQPTAQEIGTLTQQLNAAERDPRNAVRATTNKNGVVEYTGGIKPVQYISDLIKKLPEFATKQSQAQDLTTKSIQSTALANGLKLSPDQLKSYSDRVKNGEDIKTIESQIRTTAGLGQPDNIKKMLADGSDLNTIYDPYRRVMATSLGLAPDSITLDDPTLRMAIGPDKEMSLYDYQKAIRKDSRWKNSQEANDEVTNMINQVKRDFGFMG
jgi:hypothetical protein